MRFVVTTTLPALEDGGADASPDDVAPPDDVARPDAAADGGGNRCASNADCRADQVVGRASVEAHGGRVELVALEPGRSTTALLEHIRRGA